MSLDLTYALSQETYGLDSALRAAREAAERIAGYFAPGYEGEEEVEDDSY